MKLANIIYATLSVVVLGALKVDAAPDPSSVLTAAKGQSNTLMFEGESFVACSGASGSESCFEIEGFEATVDGKSVEGLILVAEQDERPDEKGRKVHSASYKPKDSQGKTHEGKITVKTHKAKK